MMAATVEPAGGTALVMRMRVVTAGIRRVVGRRLERIIAAGIFPAADGARSPRRRVIAAAGTRTAPAARTAHEQDQNKTPHDRDNQQRIHAGILTADSSA